MLKMRQIQKKKVRKYKDNQVIQIVGKLYLSMRQIQKKGKVIKYKDNQVI